MAPETLPRRFSWPAPPPPYSKAKSNSPTPTDRQDSMQPYIMNEREVAEYLLANPDFFAEHAELLGSIRLSNPHGKSAVSLQERQMEMLRDKNKQMERRLAELLRYGHENDSIAAKFNRWTLRVISERDPYALPKTIPAGLCEIFQFPQAALRAWYVADPPT